MKESTKRYANPFLCDEETEKVNLWTQELDHSNNEDDTPLDFCKKENELYTDKNAMECELPEGAFHVKDICVDEGIPHQGSILFDENNNEKADNEKIADLTINEPINDQDSKECGTHEDVIDSNVPNELMSKDDTVSKTADNNGEEKNRPLPSLKSLLESGDQQPCQSPVDKTSKTPVENESTKEENTTLNLNKTDASKLQDAGPDSVSVVNRGGEGESSFSVAGPTSGLVTNSGHIGFSGSTSIRSDSSTTSTQSFAFPILQNEWNSSPVRMAKADRRRLQKHRGWRHGLLCFRF